MLALMCAPIISRMADRARVPWQRGPTIEVKRVEEHVCSRFALPIVMGLLPKVIAPLSNWDWRLSYSAIEWVSQSLV